MESLLEPQLDLSVSVLHRKFLVNIRKTLKERKE